MDDRRISVEEFMEFPIDYSFKAVIHNTHGCAKKTLLTVQTALGDDRRVESKTRLSKKGAYISITTTARLESIEELKNAYAALRKMEGLITVL